MDAKFFNGTASWSDPEFVRDWHPKGLAAGCRLEYSADRFGLVEVNYHAPRAALRFKEMFGQLIYTGELF